jgi:surface polysaccharide O-acyltransferase-like enzyme
MAVNAKLDRNFQLELIRALACIGVVVIHLFYPIYSRPDFLGGKVWWLATWLSSVSLVAVPWFVMLSGYLLLDKEEKLQKTLKRWWWRIMVPLMIWFPIYVWWQGYWLGNYTSRSVVLEMILSGSLYHMYYLVILAGLYLTLPLWRAFYLNSRLSVQIFYAAVFFGIGMGINWLEYFGTHSSSLVSAFTWWLLYAGFFLAGGIFKKVAFSPKILMGAAVFFIGSWAATMMFEYWGVKQAGAGVVQHWRNGVFYFNTFLSPNIVVLSLSGFILLSNLKVKLHSFLKESVLLISKYSYAIYLVHPMVINIVDRKLGFSIELMEGSLLPFLTSRSMLVLIFSVIVGVIIYYSPLVRSIVGEPALTVRQQKRI